MTRVASTFDTGPIAQALTRAGVAGKPAWWPAAAADTGGDRQLSGFGRRTRRGRITLDVRFDVDQATTRLTFTPSRPSVGAWKLLEAGSYKAGSQWRAPRRRGAARRRRGEVGRYTRSPVPAKGTWSRSVEGARRTVVTEFHRTRGMQLQRAWR